jgi:dUTP pyrophosphatase
MNIRIQKLHPDALEPVYATAGAAAFDLFSLDAVTLYAQGTATFRTGLAFEIPDGHVMLVFSRSGHGFRNSIGLVNSVGVVDADFRGEVLVKLRNDGEVAVEFPPHSRVAQAMIVPVPRVAFEVAHELSQTVRDTGGLGSTGT